jgi:hypothetical protein
MGFVLNVLVGAGVVIFSMISALFINAAVVLPAAQTLNLEPLFVAGIIVAGLFLMSKKIKALK